MIKDWNAYADIAFQLLERVGMIPVFGEFKEELEEVVVDCVAKARLKGRKQITFIINSNGGSNDTLTSMRGITILAGLKTVGIVIARARSNGFRLLQLCEKRLAIPGANLMFHWGSCSLGNADISALMDGQDWPIEHIKRVRFAYASEIAARTGISLEALMQYANYERQFTAEQALEVGLLDEIIPRIPEEASSESDLISQLETVVESAT